MSDLTNVPGIGTKKERVLIDLGYDSLAAMKDADPEELYTKACLLKTEQLDKCVLYAFRCAVAYAKDPNPDPEKYRWWYFTDEKEKERNRT